MNAPAVLARGLHKRFVVKPASPAQVDALLETLVALAAEVVLRWALQKGQAVIPKSGNAEHIASNLALFDFVLSEEEVAAIDALDGVVPEKEV